MPSSSDRSRIEAILRGSVLSASIPDLQGRVAALFSEVIGPLLKVLGIDAALVEVYSPNRATTCRKIEDAHYIVFDHGESLCMGLLEALLAAKAPAHVVAAALHKALAEAARGAQRTDIYGFLIRRAAEVHSALPFQPASLDGAVATAQSSLILLHECSHALPMDHPLREAAEHYAVLKISSLSTQWIRTLSTQFSASLELQFPNIPTHHLEEWIAFRDGLGVDDEQLGDAIHAVASDERFLSEIACDRAALVLQQAIIENERSALTEENFLELAEEILAASYRTFLHLRFLKYIDDVFLHLPQHVLTEKINPLDLRSMVAAGFRGTVVGQLVIDAALELGDRTLADRLLQRLASIQGEHQDRLFVPLGQLLEQTVLNAGFHAQLPELLAEDGISAVSNGASELDSVFASDSIWLSLASTPESNARPVVNAG